eukprot:15433281-Alexandrium_andersonii.AAC.1
MEPRTPRNFCRSKGPRLWGEKDIALPVERTPAPTKHEQISPPERPQHAAQKARPQTYPARNPP